MTTGAALKRSFSFISLFLIAAVPAAPTATAADPYPAAAAPQTTPPASVDPNDNTPEVNPATGATYARLRQFEGGISLRREDESSAGEAKLAVNSPLLPGDQIWSGEDGRAEVQLADGTILRLDRNSRLSFQNLSDQEAAFDNTTLLRLLNGSLYIRADSFDPRVRRFQVDTPAGSVFLLGSGVFRVDVAANGVSTVASYRGVAEVLGDDISVMAHSGERVTVEPGKKPTEARAFNTLRRDPFDEWSENRDDAYVRTDAARGETPEVPEPVKPYVSELSAYGAWRYDASYGWIWIPDGQTADWRPYYYGQWSYAPIGMTWVSYDPWGWAPYHYGRWGWAIGLGWYWAPGYVYSGAYVSWAVGPAYYGWAPLGYYGYPVYCGGYYPWTYVPYGSIYYPYVYHHAYGWADVARHHMYDNSYVLHAAPRIRPGYRPETVGATTYKQIAASPATARPVSGISANAKGRAFRDDDAMQHRRQVASRSIPERKMLGAKPGLNRPSGLNQSTPAGRSLPARPGSMAPKISSGAGMRTFTTDDGIRTLPVNMGRQTGKGGYTVSPATGRPMQPPVRVVPAPQARAVGQTQKPTSNILGPSEDPPVPRASKGSSDSTPGQEKPIVGRGGRITYRPETPGQAPRAAAPNGQKPRPNPHPRVQPGRGTGAGGPFVMQTRPSTGVSKPSTMRPGVYRPPQASAPRAAAAPQGGGGGKKGGKH